MSFRFSYCNLLLPAIMAKTDGKSGHFLYFFLPSADGLAMDAPSEEITTLLKAWGGGDAAALERLAEQVYPQLRLMARRYMKNERPGNTLEATALVHEVYLR